MFGLKKRRRARLMRTAPPPEWIAVLERNVPYYELLPGEDRRELAGLIQVFLAEKSFEGCDGLEVTDEMRVTIAAHACILLLHRGTDVYPLLSSILLYPRSFIAPLAERGPDGVVIEDEEERNGESWDLGALVLSWDDCLGSAAHPHDGYNVMFHEFAHQLDDEAGIADGAPRINDRALAADWKRTFAREFEALAKRADKHVPTLLDWYGAESPAEFFAVATETFFERPAALRNRHPELYDLLARFYRQDPATLEEREQ
jgi:Mlc titration factor MtfA (ptsG expression regulator)